MNGIERITQRMEDDAQREIDEILSAAQAQAAEITQSCQAQAEREAREIVDRGRRNADERVERLASVAQLEARKMELAAKQEMIAKAFDLAMEQLLDLPESEYVALLASLAAKASVTGKETVILSQKDRTRYGKQVVTQANEKLGGAHLTLSEQSRPIKGGLILADGDVEVNCTFETLVRLQKGALEQQVAQVLFQ